VMTEENSKWLTDKYWVAELNYADEVRKQLTLPEEVHIHDATLREAEQAPHVVIKPDEKLRIYDALNDLGVYSIELLPIISPDDREVAKDLVKMRREGRDTRVFFLCRLDEGEVDFAAETGADGVVVECPGSPWHAQHALGMSGEQMMERLTAVSAYAKKCGLYTSSMPWEVARAPLDHLERMYKMLGNAGVDEITYADSTGCGIPAATTYMVKKIKEWAPGVRIALHGHNDFGLATAFMLTGVSAGASTVHTSINPLGERAGNAATEEVAVALELLLAVDTGVKLDRIYDTTRLLSEITKIPIPMNKAVSGDNEFTFESGMVVDIQVRMAKTDRPSSAQAFSPQLIGRKGLKFVFGKMTGGASVRYGLEKLGLSATKDEVSEIVKRVKREAIIRKWSIPDELFEAIAREVIHGR